MANSWTQKIAVTSAIFLALLIFSPVSRGEGPLRLSSFSLSDTLGKEQKLPGSGLVVLIENTPGCPIVQRYTPTLNRLFSKYSAKGVQFYFIDSAKNPSKQSNRKQAKNFKLKIPLFLDSDQSLAKALSFTTSSEVALVDAESGEVIYRGSIDNSQSLEARKLATEFYLRDAIDARLEGKAPKVKSTRPFGCLITF